MFMPRATETDAYVFIKNVLGQIGWNTRNPNRNEKGQVYTKQECLDNKEIAKYLGTTNPENIIKITDTKFWVIEAKRYRNQINQAIKEAKEDYAEKINQSKSIKAILISGVAGNEDDGYLIKSKLLVDDEFKPITVNGRELSGFLSPEIVEVLLRTNNPEIKDIPINEKLFLSKAEEINEILHTGAIEKNDRAKVMASLLLSLVDDTMPNADSSPSVFIGDINNRVKHVLERENKGEFYSKIALELPTSSNHIKYKLALFKTFQELNNLNIRSAMNSGNDVLGKFYEVFLKYGNGAKEIGIVLTPRHITNFVADVINLQPNDIILDPCCGTGGFLVAAFDRIRKDYESQLDTFKKSSIFGIDQSTSVIALAIVNMIFRGDGKNNIIEHNCFSQWLVQKSNGTASAKYSETQAESGKEPITKVLMNPPFPTKKNDEKEYKFVDHALKQMRDGGILFTVLPYAAMVKNAGGRRFWREELLKNNTLLSVITFPEDLFYPTGVITIGVFVKKGIQHPPEQKVLWIRALHDGLSKQKGKRLPDKRALNDLEKIRTTIKTFLIDQSIDVPNIPEFQKACKIGFRYVDGEFISSDKRLELIPEAFLDDRKIEEKEIHDVIEQAMRDNIAFKIKFEKELKDDSNENT